MKLKKIASLMLAGVMAASMLAGCNTASNGGNNGGEGEGEGEGTASGYSSVLADNLSADAKKDYITYQDNASDVAALEDALGNLGSVTTGGGSILPRLVCLAESNPCLNKLTGLDLMIEDFIDNAKLYGTDIDESDLSFVWCQNLDTNVVVKDATLYAIDGTVDANKAVKQVASRLDQHLSKLPKESDKTMENGNHYTYDYTVSVSVVNKPVTVIDGYHASANFIAVTVTRVPTAA